MNGRKSLLKKIAGTALCSIVLAGASALATSSADAAAGGGPKETAPTPSQIIKSLLDKSTDSVELRAQRARAAFLAARGAKNPEAKTAAVNELPPSGGAAGPALSKPAGQSAGFFDRDVTQEQSETAAGETAGEKLSLEKCVEIARGTNLQILESLHNLDSQKYKIGQAKAPLKPQTSAGAKASWQGSDSSSRAGSSNSSYAGRGASLTFSQVVYDGGKLKSGVEAAEKSLQVAELNHRKLLMDTFLKICENYYSLITSLRLEKVARQTYEGALLHQTLAEANFNVGISPKTDFIRAQANTFEKKYSLIAAQNSLKKARLALNYTLGRPGCDIFVVDSLACDTMGIELEKAVEIALTTRTEVAAAKKNIEILRLQIEQIRAEKKPQLSIGANAGVDFDNSAAKNERSSYSMTASFSFPITNGYLTENKLGEIEEKIRAAERNLEQLILTIKYDVTQAYLNLLEAYEQIGVAAKNAEYADMTLKLTDEQYKVGLATMIDLIDAELAYSRAMTNHIQSQGNFLIARCKFRRNIGDEEFYR